MSSKENAYLAQIIPVLPVGNVLVALEFYLGKLKFDLIYTNQERDPHYAVLVRDGIRLHLKKHNFEHSGPLAPVVLRIKVQGIQVLFNQYRLMGVFHNHTSLEEKPWGTLEFGFYDPYKNRLIFYHPL